MAKERKVGVARTEGRTEYVFYFSVALISVGVIAYVWSQPWAYTRTGDGLSMAAFPTIFTGGLILFSVTGALLKRTRHQEHPKPPTDSEPFLWPVNLLTSSVCIATFGLWYFDAVITSSLLVSVLLLAGKVSDWRVLAGISVGTGALIYILFILLLGVYFPHGWFR